MIQLEAHYILIALNDVFLKENKTCFFIRIVLNGRNHFTSHPVMGTQKWSPTVAFLCGTPILLNAAVHMSCIQPAPKSS